MAARLSHADRSELTRRALLDAAQELFATQGYAATSTVAIARRAKRSQGALQYHFPDKVALFQAVYAEQNAAVLDFIVERMQAADGDLWQQTVVATDAYLDKVTDTRRLRILYLDAPVVLGRAALHRTGPWLGLLRQLFVPLLATGVIAPLPLNPLIHLVWAALYEAGNYVAHAADPLRAQAEMRILLLHALTGLRSPPRGGPKTADNGHCVNLAAWAAVTLLLLRLFLYEDVLFWHLGIPDGLLFLMRSQRASEDFGQEHLRQTF